MPRWWGWRSTWTHTTTTITRSRTYFNIFSNNLLV